MSTKDSGCESSRRLVAPDSAPVRAWDELSIADLVALDAIEPLRFRSRHGDPNLNGRSYGGQVLGQAMMAACMTVDDARLPTMLQFLFLQGADPARTVDFEVTVLQDGKRFASRHVRAFQGSKIVADANMTFALEQRAPKHEQPTAALETDPGALQDLHDMPVEWDATIRRLGGYSLQSKPSIEFRIPEPERQLGDASQPRFRFWMRARRALPASPAVQASAFAYLSDWWLNFATLGSHARTFAQDERIYVSSLNHGIWFHRPFEVDQWLHVDTHSPCASAGRGLAIGTIHDLQGRLVATATQECLMAFV